MAVMIWILALLTTYRVSHMIAGEEGPFGIFHWVRSHVDSEQKTWVGRGLNCIMCVSFWIALPVSWLVIGYLSWLHWLGLAGGVLVLRQMLPRY